MQKGGFPVRLISCILMLTFAGLLFGGEVKEHDPGTLPYSLTLLNHPFLNGLNNRLILQTSIGFTRDWEAPISLYRGDRLRLGIFRLDYHLATGVELQVRGIFRQKLSYDVVAGQPLPAGEHRSAQDVGDFYVTTIARLLRQKGRYPALGLRIETKLPNTNQDKGLGPNTTDLFLTVIGSRMMGRLSAFSEIGVGILSAPISNNKQNDVLVYAAGFHWRTGKKLLMAGEVRGRVSTRKKVITSTENRGVVQIGAVYTIGAISIEVFPSYGLHHRSGKLGISAGLSWQLQFPGGNEMESTEGES